MTSFVDVEIFSKELILSYCRLEILNQDLREKNERFRYITEFALDAIIGINENGMIIFWNAGAELIFGYKEDNVFGHPLDFLMPQRYRNAHNQGLRRIKETGESRILGSTVEVNGLHQQGHEIPLEMTIASWMSKGQIHYVAILRNISARKESEKDNERLQQSRLAISSLLKTALEPLPLQEQLQHALEIILSVPWLSIQSKGSIFLVDEETGELVLTVEKGLATYLLTSCSRIPRGYCLCGRAAENKKLVYSKDIDARHDVMFDGIQPHGHYCVPILSRDHLLGVVNLYLPAGHQEDGEEIEFLTALTNTLAGIIERKRIETHLEHIAHHDLLTGLPNRKLFLERLAQDLARSKRNAESLAIMYLDLDKFKFVNDTMGHEVGDRLLIEVAQRLKRCLREGDSVARIGGDEFVVSLQQAQQEISEIVADKIIDQLGKPFQIRDHVCHIGTSIGISFFPEHGHNPEILMQRADMAMYAVKRRGRNSHQFFMPDMEKNAEIME
ncbi:MAG: diguanylate cyclase [Magnetococcus sp. DMHC-6]